MANAYKCTKISLASSSGQGKLLLAYAFCFVCRSSRIDVKKQNIWIHAMIGLSLADEHCVITKLFLIADDRKCKFI